MFELAFAFLFVPALLVVKLPFPRRPKAWLIALVSLTAVAVVSIAPMMRSRAQGPPPPPTYTFTDLGTLGGTYSRALGINNCGQVVGEATLTGAFPVHPTHPFIWRDMNPNLLSDAGEMKDLGTLGGVRGSAADINASGLVVGTLTTLNGDEHAFRWFDLDGAGTPDPGEMNDLGVLPDHSTLGAYGVNDNGQIVGTAEDGFGEASAFIWDANTGLQLLATLGGIQPSHGYAINNSSHIAGYARNIDHAFVYNGTTNIDLGTLGPDGIVSIAYDINAAGHAVGFADVDASTGSPPSHAFKWTGTLPLQDLGVLTGGVRSEASSINSSGTVVGYSEVTGGARHAFVHDGTMYDLNTVGVVTNLPAGWVLLQAHAINDGGQIVGEACTTNDCSLATGTGETRAFLLTPTAFTPTCSPTVTVAVSPASVSEDGATNLTYTFTRAPVTSTALTVNFSVGGTATFSTDYAQTGADTFGATSGTVIFSPFATTATVTLNPATDATVETDETAILTVTSGLGYIVGSPSAATGTITNDDLPNVSVAVSPLTAVEDGVANLVYTFTRTSTIGGLTVNFSVGGTASASTDYVQTGAASFAPPSGTVSFANGSNTATVTVNPTTDATVESDETVILTVTSGTGYTVGSPSAATGTITNDDTTVSVAVSPASVSEDGVTNLTYTFTRTGVTSGALTVNFSVGGAATFSTDYGQSGAATFNATSGTVTFLAGASTATVTLNPTTDATVETDETATLTVTSGTGYIVGSPSAATGTITTDDLPTVSVAVSPISTAEDGSTNLVYTFTRDSTIGGLTVNFSVGGTASASTDYGQTGAASFTPPNGTVSFANGSNTATVTVNPTTDATVESDETVILTVTAGTGYNVGSPSVATGTITNDDTTVSVAVSPASVSEDGVTNLTYTFTRTGVTGSALTVNFSVGGAATFSTDYGQSGAATFNATSGTVTFGAGASIATVTLNPTTDATVETDETATLTVTSGTGYNVVSPSAVTGTITNDDLPNVSVAVSPISTAEDGLTNLVYTFTRNSTIGSLTVNFSVGGTADASTDYGQTGAASFTPPAGTVSFANGSNTATVTVNPTTDATVESDETVILTVTTGTGYTIGSPSVATGTITNDDTTVSVAVSPLSVAEDGSTNLTYTFTRTGVTSGALTVNFSVASGGNAATFSTDYAQTGAATFGATGTVTFAAGAPTATVTLNPTTDSTVETDETATLTVTSGTGYNVVSPSVATGTITNDDTNVSVTVSPASVSEDGSTNLVYTFTRTGVTTGAIVVNFSVGSVGNAATFSTDYAQTGATSFSSSAGTISFGNGETVRLVTVNPTTDATVESDETVILTVTTGTSYNVGSPSVATGTITNDDTNVSVAVSPASVSEDGVTNLTYTFTRTGVTGSALTANFSVGGTAAFSTDYGQTGAATFNATSGTVTFSAGALTTTVTLNPTTDSTVETDETAILTLTAATGYNVSSPSVATGTITNDDLPTVSVAVSPISTAEDGSTNLVYTFTRSSTIGSLTVNFSVGGTAVFGTDYAQTGAATFNATSGTVTFTAGASTTAVTLNPTTDSTVEDGETAILTVTTGTGYTVGSPSVATGTITNDDTNVSVAVSPASVAEDGAPNLVYTFTRNSTVGSLTVNFSVGGTASASTDYVLTATSFTSPNGTVTFLAGASTATVTVNPTTDTTDEPNETVLLTITPDPAYTISGSPATGTITR